MSFNLHLCSFLSANLWSHLNSTHTFKVSERPFVPTLWSHCPPKSAHSSLTQLHLQSVFTSQSCSEEGRPEIHLSQIFRSFYQQMVWLSFHTNFLHPHLLGIFTLTAQEEILSWRLPHSGSSPITNAIMNPEGTQQCQTWTLLINRSWKRGLHLFFLA